MDPTATTLDATSHLRELPTEQGVLRYHEIGEGPPLVLLHGSGPGVTGWRNFSGNLETFSRHFRCLVLELPGFGVSHPTDRPLLPASVEAATRLLDGLGLDRVDVVGNSMGGIAGAILATERPDRVRRLVTVGGVGRNLLSPGPGEGINLLMDFTDDPTRERLVDWLHSMVYDRSIITEEMIEQRWQQATEPATLAGARGMYGREAFEATAAAMADSDAAPYWAMLHKIKAKTLITWGRDDRVSPVDMALLPMRTIPDVELHIFPDCGHWAMIEQKDAWESVVLAFLTRPDAS
ncbi:alpha/beta fold hydrolase [Prauserella halophila]|uniref:Alpha/beta fold hydrolase n=1 Tax=Prauserella halophila TaxID=185641 RepID=A0ABN1W0D2_9PSEU|nr:alpha/beta fold hydrolase [Prauserella halophila]MCP2237418.1 2-hydroxy-6-oxonona-2,4-dienedioate hydrolase [Prauserella halophila]